MKFIKPISYIVVAIIALIILIQVYGIEDYDAAASLGLNLSYALVGLIVAAALIFPIMYTINHPKTGVPVLIGIVALGAMFGIGYALAGDEITFAYEEVGVTSASVSKTVGGALNLMYVALATIVGATIFSEVRSLLK